MRFFTEPTGPNVPIWLKATLTSIRAALSDIWPTPLRLKDYATADLPTAADWGQGLVWNATTLTVNWSDGSAWKAPQASDPQLDAIAGLTPAADQFIYWTGPTTAAMTGITLGGRLLVNSATPADMRNVIGTVIGVDVQAYDVQLDALAAATGYPPTGDQINYWSGLNTSALTALTAFGRSLIDDANAAAAQTTLGLVIGTNVQAFDADLSALAANSTDGLWAHTGAGTGAARTITGTANEITVADGNGVSGNPTLSLPTAMTFTGKTVTGGTFNITTLTVSGPSTLGDSSGDSHTLNGTLGAPLGSSILFNPAGSNGASGIGFRNNTINSYAIYAADGGETSQGPKGVLSPVDGSLVTGVALRFLTGSTANQGFIWEHVASAGTAPAVIGELNNAGVLNITGEYRVDNTRVVTNRATGWGAMTGTAARTAAAVHAAQTITNPPTQAEVQNIDNSMVIVAQRLKALIDDLTTHGLIGP